MAKSFLQNLGSKYQKTKNAVSREWLKVNFRSIVKAKDFESGIPKVGNMCMYLYPSPKYKKVLDYYDQAPVVLVIGLYNNGFLGINFHYLPEKLRAYLLDTLMKLHKSNPNEDDRLKVSYAFLNGVSKYKAFRPCVHRYLWSHIKSKIKMVPVSQWENAIYLDVVSFKSETGSASTSRIYADSKAKM